MQMVESRRSRTADPYLDTDVVDERAPRTNQAAVAIATTLALVSGAWWIAGLMGVQLAVGLVLGRKYCLPCVFYFEVLQPILGEGLIEDARPPRFANILGAGFLGAASLAHLLGLSTLGWFLIGAVAILATVAVVSGFCLGCTMYRVIAHLRGVRPGSSHERLDPADFDLELGGPSVVQFTHPLCSDCHKVEGELRDAGHPLVLVDVSKRGDLARKYNVGVVPLALEVTPHGKVLQRIV